MYRNRPSLRTALTSATACLAIGALAAGALAASAVTVSQRNRAFSVQSLQIAHGDTVHFTNDDEFTHQIYIASPGMSFESDEQTPGNAVDIAFPNAGSVMVLCHIHPKMSLNVKVQ